jgi:hypothetical protein
MSDSQTECSNNAKRKERLPQFYFFLLALLGAVFCFLANEPAAAPFFVLPGAGSCRTKKQVE